MTISEAARPAARDGRRLAIAAAVTALLVTIAVVLAWRWHGAPTVGIDDANIFFVYAEHLAEGHGLVYNVGGERVEGMTSLLYTLVAALAFLAARWLPQQHAAELAMLVLDAALLIASLAAMVALVDRLTRGVGKRGGRALSPWAWLFLVLVLAQPAYVVWTTITLLDVGLWSALLALGLAVALWPEVPAAARARRLAAFAVLATLTRPEAMVVVPVLLVLFALHGDAPEGLRGRLRAVRTPLAAFALALVGLTVFRLAYFGYPLPNTYYAKVSPSLAHNLTEGGRYLAAFLANGPIAPLGALAAAFVVVRGLARRVLAAGRRERSAPRSLTRIELVAAVALVLLLLPVAAGGDHFRMFRFFQPAQPALCLLLVLGLRRVVPARWLDRLGRAPRAARLALGLAGAAGVAAVAARDATWWTLPREQPLANEFRIAEGGLLRGERLRAFFAEEERLPALGVVAAGAIKRGYAGEVVDLMGLNDTRMGHSGGDRVGIKNHAAFDRATFFELAPRVLEVSFDAPGGERLPTPVIRRFDREALKGLFEEPEFHARYGYAYVTRAGHRRRLGAFFERGFLDELRSSGVYGVVALELGRVRPAGERGG